MREIKKQVDQPQSPNYAPPVCIVDGDGDLVDFREITNLLQDIKQELIKLNAK